MYRLLSCATGHTPPVGGGLAPLLPPPLFLGFSHSHSRLLLLCEEWQALEQLRLPFGGGADASDSE
jgi:hypothetical protein